MAGKGGPVPGAGRKPGSTVVRSRKIANELAREGLTPLQVLIFGSVLSALSFVVLWWGANLLTALLALAGWMFLFDIARRTVRAVGVEKGGQATPDLGATVEDISAVTHERVRHAPRVRTVIDFVYARLMRTRSEIATGYADRDLKRWAERARLWASGGEPSDLPRVDVARVDVPRVDVPRVDRSIAPRTAIRDVFVYFISGAKERNPSAAMALLRKLGAV